MRKLLFVIAGAGLLLALAAPVVMGESKNKFEASLNGYMEVPSISTTARGSFKLDINGSTIDYRLTFRDLSTPTLFAHIHFARPDVNGSVAAFLCGGGGKPACPASGTVTGTIVAADVVGPAAQGIAAGEFAELVRAIRNGATYANVHSEMFPGGEIRGNIRRD
ncbi:MAG: CHRD domain-containing protein [Candidatus Limnocylindrales bacterium]